MDSILHFLQSLLTTEGLRQLVISGGYFALIAIVFSETGLLIGFFLPGDSLLVSAGLLIATGMVDMSIVTLNLVLIAAAVLGDATGYLIGKRAGHALYSRPNSRLFKREHLLRTHAFYEKHGGKTIVLARFIPIVRTFAPVVAGAAEMGYRHFAAYNIIGATLWIISTTMLGYGLAHVVPNVERYLHLVIAVVIVASLIPPLIEWMRHRKRSAAPAED